MTRDDFIILFHSILDSRDEFKDALSANEVVPEFAFTDEEIKQYEDQSKKAVICAGIRNGNVFCFRKKIIETAPEFVLFTMIQHELIHTVLFPRWTTTPIERPKPKPKNPLDKYSFVSPETESFFKQILHKIRLDSLLEDQYESEVRAQNDKWGGQEQKSRDWLQQKGFL